jgi:cytochrome c biogenesis protein CcmG/thiol:disulfide interchange protein DsbE
MDIAHSNKVFLYGLNYKDKRDVALSWLKQFGNPYLLDIYDPKGELGLNLGVYGTPETFLIDQNGIIRYKYIGELTTEVWQQEFLPRIQRLEGKV